MSMSNEQERPTKPLAEAQTFRLLAVVGAFAILFFIGLGFATMSGDNSNQNALSELLSDPGTLIFAGITSAAYTAYVVNAERWSVHLSAIQRTKLEERVRTYLEKQPGGPGGLPLLTSARAEDFIDRSVSDQNYPVWLRTGTPVLVALGLAGTFFGLSLGLLGAGDFTTLEGEKAITDAMAEILSGARLAFVKSLLGVSLGTLWSFRQLGLEAELENFRANIRRTLSATIRIVSPEDILIEQWMASNKAQARTWDLLIERQAQAEAHANVQKDGINLLSQQLYTLTGGLQTTTSALKDLEKPLEQLVSQGDRLASQGVRLALEHENLQRELEGGRRQLSLDIARGTESQADLRASAQRGFQEQAHSEIRQLFATLLGEKLEDGQSPSLSGVQTLLTDQGQVLGQLADDMANKTGSQVTAALQTTLTDMRLMFEKMGDSTASQMSEQIQNKSGETLGAFNAQLDQITQSLSSLPELLSGHVSAAGANLEAASQRQGQSLQVATDQLARQTGQLIAQLHDLLTAMGKLEHTARDFQGSGQRFHDALHFSLPPLQELPIAFKGAGEAAQRVAEKLHSSSETIGQSAAELREASKLVESALRSGAEDAQANLQRGGDALLHPLIEGTANLERALQKVGESTQVQQLGLLDSIAKVQGEGLRSQERASGQMERLTTHMEALSHNLQTLMKNTQSSIATIQTLPERLDAAVQAADSRLTDSSRSGAEKLSASAGEIALAGTALAGHLTGLEGLVAQVQRSATGVGVAGERFESALSAALPGLTALPTRLDGVHEALTLAGQEVNRGAHATEIVRASLLEVHGALDRSVQGATDRERQARQDFDHLQLGILELGRSVDRIRDACETTVNRLSDVTGQQQAGAAQAISDLLRAVSRFEEALARSNATMQDRAFQTVASAEQISTAAAREVAEALQKGAGALVDALHRAETQGLQLDKLAQQFTQTYDKALVSAKELEAAGQQLRADLASAGQPLREAGQHLTRVGPDVERAARAMEAERGALSGLGASLREQAESATRSLQIQAENVKEQERLLTQRSTELRHLSNLLASSWGTHAQQYELAQSKVADAWRKVMADAEAGTEKRAMELGRYAQEVERALRLPSDIRNLTEVLDQLHAALADLAEQKSDQARTADLLVDLQQTADEALVVLQAMKAGSSQQAPAKSP